MPGLRFTPRAKRPWARLPAACSAAVHFVLGDFAGCDEGPKTALRKFAAVTAHAGSNFGAVRIMLAAIGVIVGGACQFNSEACGRGLAGLARDDRNYNKTGDDFEAGKRLEHWVSPT